MTGVESRQWLMESRRKQRMLNVNTLVDAIMAEFSKKKGITAADIQNERQRLYAMRLDKLGEEYRKVTKSDKEPDGKDPHELKAA